jgi:hypothetical protein
MWYLSVKLIIAGQIMMLQVVHQPYATQNECLDVALRSGGDIAKLDGIDNRVTFMVDCFNPKLIGE